MCLIYCTSIYYGNVSRETKLNGKLISGKSFAGIFPEGRNKGQFLFPLICFQLRPFLNAVIRNTLIDNLSKNIQKVPKMYKSFHISLTL